MHLVDYWLIIMLLGPAAGTISSLAKRLPLFISVKGELALNSDDEIHYQKGKVHN